MGFTKGAVKYVALTDSWIVGTENGELFMFDHEGRQIWKRTLGVGKLITVALSRDEQVLYVGETSAQGQIFALDTQNGNILWQYGTDQIIGSEPAKRSLPAVVQISVDQEDRVFLNAYRFLMSKDAARDYNSAVLAFDRSGKLLWRYPQDEVMDTWINWLDANGADGIIAVSSSAYELRADMKYKDTLYFLDKETGALVNSVFIETVEPFEKTVMRGSPNYSKDGKLLAGATSDGRAYLFDNIGNVLWERTLSQPQVVDGAVLNASGRDGFVIEGKVIFTTINTFNKENWQLPTPVDHPASNSVYAFTPEGDFLYKYKARGTIEQLEFSPGLMAGAVGRNVRTYDYAAHGAVLISMENGRELAFWPTEGPLQAIAVKNDGSQVAGIEAPAVTPEGKVIGSYTLHIWQYKK